ncbi:hypothetical protein VNO78_20721 [Psophocarpus tetragonolobus]|uniref:Uncharacterized protein n=1 Tax=Psophocarpus tetragonolobus TaxID=3891 RepID=A0AAN9XH03_PSOTE
MCVNELSMKRVIQDIVKVKKQRQKRIVEPRKVPNVSVTHSPSNFPNYISTPPSIFSHVLSLSHNLLHNLSQLSTPTHKNPFPK